MLIMCLDVLDQRRQKLARELGFLKKYGFYLAGGTALALQIGHRISIDFDFYTRKTFEPDRLFAEFKRRFKACRAIRMAEGTLLVNVSKIDASFFLYDYPMLNKLEPCLSLDLASIEDIAAMKIVSISQRGIKRDFIDAYFLARKLGLEKMLRLTKKKYKGFDLYIALQALCYFNDAETGGERAVDMIKPVSWDEVKRFFISEVKHAQKLV